MTFRIIASLCLFSVSISFSSESLEYRVWTSKKGEVVNALYKRTENEKIILQIKSGREVVVDRKSLSEADMKYIDSLKGAIPNSKVLLGSIQVKKPSGSIAMAPLSISIDSSENVFLDFMGKQWTIPFDYAEFWEVADYNKDRHKPMPMPDFLLLQTVQWKSDTPNADLLLLDQASVKDLNSLLEAHRSEIKLEFGSNQIAQFKGIAKKAGDALKKLQDDEEKISKLSGADLFKPSDISVAVFHATKPTTITVFQVMARIGDYFNYEFSTPSAKEKYWSISLKTLNGDDLGYGYISKKKRGDALFSYLKDGKEHPISVRVKYLPNAEDNGCFLLEDFRELTIEKKNKQEEPFAY